MFVCNHALAGAAIGLVLPANPAAALALGVASHLALDAVPHWGLEIPKDHPDRKAAFFKVAKKDGCLCCALIGGILLATPGPRRISTAAGIFGALLPDLEHPIVHFTGKTIFPAWFRRFHAAIQRESPERLGRELRVGAVGALTLAGLILFLRR